jgi:hypothetical protein
MHEHHDIIDNALSEGLDHYDPSIPEPLDHWSLEDFGDILPSARRLS